MLRKQQFFLFILLLVSGASLLFCGCTTSNHSTSVDITTLSPTITNIPTTSNNSANVTYSLLNPYNVTSGIDISTSQPIILVGKNVKQKDLSVGITNNLSFPLEFGIGLPLRVEYMDSNGTWEDLEGGGGTQAFWYLQPGESKILPPISLGGFTIVPGLYRIRIYGEIESKPSVPFVVQKEFTLSSQNIENARNF